MPKENKTKPIHKIAIKDIDFNNCHLVAEYLVTKPRVLLALSHEILSQLQHIKKET